MDLASDERSIGDLHRAAFHFLVQRTSLGKVARKVHFDTLVIVTEMKGQFVPAMMAAKNISQVSLNTVLPNVTLKGFEELPAAIGTEADRTGELTQDSCFEDGFGDGLESAMPIDIDLHVFIVARLQFHIHQNVSAWLIFKKSLEARQAEEVIASGKDKGEACQLWASQPDAAQDSVVLVKGIEDAAGALMAVRSDGLGVEADGDKDIVNPGPLELIENIAEQGFSAQIQERFVLTISQILQTGAQTRGGDESFHPLLLKAFRSLWHDGSGRRTAGILLQRLTEKKGQILLLPQKSHAWSERPVETVYSADGSFSNERSTWNT